MHGYLLVGGEKMSKTRLNQIAPADLVDEFGVDGFRYHFLRDTPFGPDGDFSYEAMISRYNADLANNFGNLLSRVATVVAKKCDGIGPAPRPDSPLAAVAAEVYAATAEAWDAVAPILALDAHLAAHPRGQRAPRGGRALEGRSRPRGRRGAGRRARGAAAGGGAGQPGHPRLLRRGLVPHRPVRFPPPTSTVPAAASWGGYPGGLPVEKGDAPVPAAHAHRCARGPMTGEAPLGGPPPARWIDTHCHLDLGDDHPADPAAGEAGAAEAATDRWARVDEALADARAHDVGRFVTVATDHASSQTSVEVAARHPDVWATVGLHPHDAKLGVDGLEALLDAPRVVAVGECGLDYHYEHSPPRRAAGRVRGPDRPGPPPRPGPGGAHPGGLGRHLRRPRRRGRAASHRDPLLHGWARRGAARCLDRGTFLSFSGIVTFRNATDVQAAAERCPIDRLLVETDSPFLAPVPHRGKPNRPAWVPAVGEAVAGLKGLAPAELAAAVWANAERVFRFS